MTNSTGPSAADITWALSHVESNGFGDEVDADSIIEEAAQAHLAMLQPQNAGELAAEAEREARTMAPPVPGVTQNAGYTVRAVLPGHDAEPGLLASCYVAAEGPGGAWVTWNAYTREDGHLSYDAGHYFHGPDARRLGLADLAERALGLACTREQVTTALSRAADEAIVKTVKGWF